MPPRRRSAAPSGPTRVEAIQHGDKRSNIPTADAADDFGFVAEPKQLRYDRDPALDPQLVWRGKDDQDASDLLVDAPPIYIQEKINPLVLIENLRRTARSGEPEPELSLFDTFDGLDELDAVDFYRHQANWSNRMILGDSLQVMASLAERESLRGKVQMIYLDPPYGIKFGSNWQASARKRDVKDGKVEDAAREAEQIKAFRDTWELGIHSYLAYLRDRLIVARDLLTESGSIFVQIGDENVHLVRSLLDEVFGSENFVSLISFVTTSGFSQSTALGRSGDYLAWYACDLDQLKARAIFRVADGRQSYRWIQLANGATRSLTKAEREVMAALPAGARLYAPDNIQSQGAASEPQPFRFKHSVYSPGSTSHWKARYPEGMDRLALANRIHVAKNSIRYIRFADDFGLQAFTNNWTDTATGNFTDDKLYVVQTSTKVIERCMLMSTDPGDLVLDPTCGSGTTAYVAEQWGRRWITIDTSRVALALARQRLMGAKYPYYLIADSAAGRAKEHELTGKAAPSDQVGDDIRLGFVYERVQHITLKSIANNPDICEGMTREQIDAAIRRHADFEVLYDKPYEDRATVRVSGPFTVESLTPHRSLTFGDADENSERETLSEYHAATDPEGPTFEQTVLDNLVKAGVQIGRRAERIEFASLDPHAGTYLNAIGTPVSAEDTAGSARRVGIAIGPQYGTVDPPYVKHAVREAIAVGDIDLLCVMAFSFDAQTAEVTEVDGVDVRSVSQGFAKVEEVRTVGRLRLLKVRMNHDLLMGEELKKTGAGNLFTVFGEPDIDLRPCPDGFEVEIRGIDVYDPTTGEVRSGGTDKLALWMIDTNYNEEAFFVRHCYFTGGLDPYKKLKAALKADIDTDAWESLTRTTSRPFPRPDTGRIAVKVINDFGDEVMKVYSV